jgi:hypothetical protein
MQNVQSVSLVRFQNGVSKEQLVTPAPWIRVKLAAANIDFVQHWQ